MTQHTGMESEISRELTRRTNMWESLCASGGPAGVAPTILRELGVYGGAQGIWVHKERTGGLTESGTGITVGLLHTGNTYADDLSSDGVLYHYPSTKRPPGRDSSEIEATKAAGRTNLPVFVITHSTSVAGTRDVYLGWVEDWDDSLGIFLVTFDEEIRSRILPTKPEEQFQLEQKRRDATRKVRARPGQQRFSFNVLRRYGRKCAVCKISVPEVLDAAHLVPDRRNGTYDPRNGIVFCAVHHRAFDAGLFGIEPDTLRIRYKANGPDADSLRVDYETLEQLPKKPHEEALRWRWEWWQKQ